MSDYFNHIPQSTSIANQVENLATEVDSAFLEVESEIAKDNQENASINSSIGSLDNKYIKEYVPNVGWIENYQQNLYFPRNSQEASLDLFPSLETSDLNTVAVSNLTTPSKTYTYKLSGVLQSDTDFTFVDRKVVFGKTPAENESLSITYKGYNTTSKDDSGDWPFELKYNVLRVKETDNSIKDSFSWTNSGSTYTVSGFNFKDLCSEFIKNVINNSPSDLPKYVAVFSDDVRIDSYDIEITNSYFKFTTDQLIGPTVKLYVANASLGRLVECIYRLFYAHDHGSNGGEGVNHGDLLGLYTNTYDSNGNPQIQYQTSTKSNYDHPQYLNREGFIADGSVYNNAMIGDFLLSSTDNGNRKNNLNSNSVKLVFGEYASGHKMYYNQADDCLWVDSISKDGIKLVVPDNKRALSINDHSFVDTQHITSETNDALKLTLKSDSNEHLGVLKLTRKLIANGLSTDDDKALLISFASEFSRQLVKENLIIGDGSKISFGDPASIEIVKEDDGLHFTTSVDGDLTDAVKVTFDIPVEASKATIDHLDAKEIHLDATQKIVYGNPDHSGTSTQFIDYSNDELAIKANKSVNYKNNGRLTGISFDNRQFIYTATPQGSTINDVVEATDLYIETKRDVYFLKTGYTYTQGITNLQQVPRSSFYADVSNVNDVEIQYDESLTNGILLNNTNKIFAQKDAQNNTSTILNSTSGVVVASAYTPGGTINYGKLTAKDFYAEGDKNTTAGFYGNVNIPVNHKFTVNGETEFNSEITYSKLVNFTDKMFAANINADAIIVKNLNVTEKATYSDLVTNNLEVLTELRFSKMLQTNHLENSVWQGTVQFNNNVYMPNGNSRILLGDPDIEDSRNNSGLLLSKDEVKLGTNGVVSAGKVIAGKGIPSGNGDTTGGFAFATVTGLSDGDTGFFAENNVELQNGSDLVFRIDGVEKARIPKEDVDLNALSLAGKEKTLVTLDQLMSQVTNLTSNILTKVYPIGTIYENSIDARNPAILLDWPSSVWRRYAVGRSLMGASGNGVGELVDDYLTVPAGLNTNAAGSKFGDFTHKMIEAELPNHKHIPSGSGGGNVADGHALIPAGGGQGTWSWNWSGQAPANNPLTQFKTTGAGEDMPHNNTHPIIITHIWERIG